MATTRAPAGPPTGQEYATVMGRTSQEYQRLIRQARLWGPATARVLGQAGIGPGMHCLDVGCGPGEVMRLLAEQVGSSGLVTEADSDGQLGREGLGVLRATLPGPSGSRSSRPTWRPPISMRPRRSRDIPSTWCTPGCCCRTCATRWRCCASWPPGPGPGGLLLVQDYDVRTADIWPPLATWGEFERVVFGVYERTGRDLRFGHKLPVHFCSAGLGEPDGTDVAGVLAPAAEVSWLYAGVFRSLLPAALRLGLSTEADSNAFLAEITTAGRERSRVVLCPLLISAWKHLPGSNNP
jgi:hypothetical protein